MSQPMAKKPKTRDDRIAFVFEFYWGLSGSRDNTGILDRFARFVGQLRNEADVDVWLCEDATNPETRTFSQKHLANHHGDIAKHIRHCTFHDSDLRQRYAYLAEGHKVQKSFEKQFGKRGAAWAFHSEVQMYWFAEVAPECRAYLQNSQGGKSYYDYIWWMEDDVEWLGPDAQLADVRELIYRPFPNNPDLAAKVMDLTIDQGAQATRTDEYAKIFTWPVPDSTMKVHEQETKKITDLDFPNPRLKIHEHVIRMRPKLLRKLYLCSMLEIAAGSENSKQELCEWAPTQADLDKLAKDRDKPDLCLQPKVQDFDTSFEPLPLDLIGSRYHPAPVIGIGQYPELQAIVAAQIGGFPYTGRLYHPVKTVDDKERKVPLT